MRCPNRISRAAHLSLLALLAVSFAVVPGCVRRRMTIRTNPPGALAFVDDQEIGITPVSSEFTYYGTRKIQLVKDGYETLTVKQSFFPPWYEFPVIEFVSENLWPHEQRNEHLLSFQMQPQPIVPPEKLLERAQELRTGAHQGYAVSLPNATATPQPVAPLVAPGPSPDTDLPVPPPDLRY